MRLNFIQRYHADVEVGAKLTLDKGDASKSLKEFKQEIKAAEGDLLNMTRQFGATSEQARNAAKRVAELKDELGDAKQLVDAFNPDRKFNALAQSLNGVLGGFTALQGAMGLLGVESEDLQKQLLKVQSALALSQGFNQVGEAINSFKTLGRTLVETLGRNGLIGVAIAGVAALTASFLGLFKSNRENIEAQRAFAKATIEARQEIRSLQNVMDQARKGVISKKDALNQYNTTIGKTLGETNDLNKAEKLLSDNAKKYIEVQGLKAKANFLMSESARLSGEAELLRMEIEGSRGFVGRALEKAIANAEAKAAKIEAKVAEINNKIAASSSGFSGNIGAAGAGVGGATGKAKQEQERQEQYTFVQGTINKINDLELQGLQQSLKNRFDATQKAQEYKAKDFANSQFYTIARIKLEENEAQAIAEIETKKAQARIEAAKMTGQALGALADLIGKQTAAGKALAIAQATINMWVGVTEVLRAKSVIPEPFGTISKVANIATIVATGLVAIRNIVKTPVPGGGGGGGAVNAPLAPQPQVTNTLLNQSQLNSIGNAAQRAFVLESDVTTNQERIRRLNRAARL